MATSSVTRSLRSGSLTLKDGSGTPKTCVAPCQKGDLKWDVVQDYKATTCRGVPDHWRKGDKVPCKISFSGYWSQLASKTVASGDATCLYEILLNRSSYFTTTSTGAGGVFSLDLVFTCTSPLGTSDETVTFEDCVITKVSCAEGDENMITVECMSLSEQPTIARV